MIAVPTNKAPQMSQEEVAGYRVTFERLRRGAPVKEVMGARARQVSVARQQAAKKSGFLRVLKIEALTEEQYAREFPAGHGRAGRYVSVSVYA